MSYWYYDLSVSSVVSCLSVKKKGIVTNIVVCQELSPLFVSTVNHSGLTLTFRFTQLLIVVNHSLILSTTHTPLQIVGESDMVYGVAHSHRVSRVYAIQRADALQFVQVGDKCIDPVTGVRPNIFLYPEP